MDDHVEALLREREGYRVKGDVDHVALVDAALKAAGYKPERRTADVAAAVSGEVVEVAVKDKPRSGRSRS